MPADATYDCVFAEFSATKPTASLNNVRSKIIETVDIKSSQKKKEKRYPYFAILANNISTPNTHF